MFVIFKCSRLKTSKDRNSQLQTFIILKFVLPFFYGTDLIFTLYFYRAKQTNAKHYQYQ